MNNSSSLNRETWTAVRSLLSSRPEIAAQVENRLRLFGVAPTLNTRHKLTVAAASAIGAYAMAIEEWWSLCTGTHQSVGIDYLQATCGLNPGQFQQQNGYSISAASLFTELKAGFYKTADNRWFYPVGSYPHLRDGVLETLGCANSTSALQAAIGQYSSETLEAIFDGKKLPGVYARTADEWRKHEQGQWLSNRPVIQIEKIGDSAPEFCPGRQRPLDSLRVLDMGHVIAGPIVARSLAEQGADVLRLSHPLQQDAFRQTVDTNIGKRSAFLDLDQADDKRRLQSLISRADVMVQSWRTDSMKGKGFGTQEAAAIRPGIIYVSVSAFGHEGPWALRGGFEQLGQAASGIALTENSDQPRLVPSTLLNDYLTGYLGALGVILALIRRAEEGGSYHVNIALTRTSMWIQELGLLETLPSAQAIQAFNDLKPLLETRHSPYGTLHQLPPVAQFSRTKAHWTLPPVPTGAHEASWS